MKKNIKYIILFLFLILILLYGKILFSYTAFKILGANVIKIGYFVDDHLSAKVSVKRNDKLYVITIRNIKPVQFLFKNTISIYDINGFGLDIYGCEDPDSKKVFNSKKNKYIGRSYITNSMNFETNGILNNFFNVKISVIPDIFENVEQIEKILMTIPINNPNYYIDKNKNEVYLKRNNHSSLTNTNKVKIIDYDSAPVFKYHDCSN